MTTTSNIQYPCIKHTCGTIRVDLWVGSGWASIDFILFACNAIVKAKIEFVSFTLHFQIMCMAQ